MSVRHLMSSQVVNGGFGLTIDGSSDAARRKKPLLKAYSPPPELPCFTALPCY